MAETPKPNNTQTPDGTPKSDNTFQPEAIPTPDNTPKLPAGEPRPVAVITGASSGIGMATALEFAKQGHNVVLAARRKEELDKVAAQCEEQGVSALAITTDTTNDKAIHALADAAVERFQQINVWVNNAGVYLTGKFEELPLEDMRRVFETNFFGYVHGSHAALTHFRRAGKGTLINVSSVNAPAPQPYLSIYSASKAAVRAFDESLRMELRLDGLQRDIHVCTVMPASIDTNLFQNAANYTGQEVQAQEPVYDPAYVARQIVKLVRWPRREVIIGPVGKLMALHNAHMPAMYEKQIAKFTKADLLGDKPAVITDGNLFEPIESNRGMRGGWREHRLRADRLHAATGAGAAMVLLGAVAATVGIIAFKRKQAKHQRHHHGKFHALFS